MKSGKISLFSQKSQALESLYIQHVTLFGGPLQQLLELFLRNKEGLWFCLDIYKKNLQKNLIGLMRCQYCINIIATLKPRSFGLRARIRAYGILLYSRAS